MWLNMNGIWIGRNSGISWSSLWAKQFATAAGITDATQISIVKDLCADFEAAGLWDKMKAIYPFIGGTADAHKFNLKDPRDADDAFRITWSGTVAHSATGIKSNGVDGYGNTHLDPNAELAYDNHHFSVFSRDDLNTDNGFEIGTGSTVIGCYHSGWGGGVFLSLTGFGSLSLVAYNNTKGLFTVDRLTNNSCHILRNGHSFVYGTDAVVDPANNNPFFICCTNNAGNPATYSTRDISFVTIGEGLTVYEEQLKYAIIRKYINAMDNHSAYNNQILFESWQPALLDQVSLTLKINTGHKIYVDWGEDVPVEITGDGSDVTVTSAYGTASKTYYARIYGELTQLIRFKVDDESTLASLNVNDFRRLNVPLYSLYLKNTKSVFLGVSQLPAGLTELTLYSINAYYGYGSVSDLPKYLQYYEQTSNCAITMDNLVNLPTTLKTLRIITWTLGGVNIDNLPSGLTNLVLLYVNSASGSLRNLPSGMVYTNITSCGTGIDIVTAPFKAWATNTIIINSAYNTASVDGFFNTYAAVAGDGAATLNLAGVGAGIANQADSAASAAAQTTLLGLSKTIQTN